MTNTPDNTQAEVSPKWWCVECNRFVDVNTHKHDIEYGDFIGGSKSDTQTELDVNKLEQIIADHNKEMRADMASEITGGTRSKAITDVITVKAILDWHNKQTLELLDRLIAQQWSFGEDDDALAVPTRYIQAERNKLKESK